MLACVRVVLCSTILVVLLGQPYVATAQTTAAQIVVDRLPTAYTRPASHVFGTRGGTLFALSDDGVWRSDDSASTWRPESIPGLPASSSLVLITVDRQARTVAYAGPDGKALYRLVNGSWQAVKLPYDVQSIEALVASPADPDIMYALTSGTWPPRDIPVNLYRTADAGNSWEVAAKPCGENQAAFGGVLFTASGWIQPDASDPQRVFTSINCFGSTGGGAPGLPQVAQSRDQGRAWSDFFKAGTRNVPDLDGDVVELAGGVTPNPGVFVISVSRDIRLGGSAVFRSVDDGQSWTRVLFFQGSSGVPGSDWDDLPNIRNPGRVAFDPARPEQVVLGQSRASADGGQGWGSVADLGLSDTAMTSAGLFGASSAGVVRLVVRSVSVQLPDTWQILSAAQAPGLPKPIGLALSHAGPVDPMLFVSFGAYKSSGVNALGADGTQVSEWSGLHYPAGLAVSSDGTTLLLDDRNSPSAVRELSPDTVTVLDGLRQKPQGVAIDSTGTMYVTFRAEGYSATDRLLQFSPAGDVINSWSDAGTDQGQFGDSLWGVAVDVADNLYVADTRNNRVQELTKDGAPVMEWGGLNGPCGVAVDADANVYVADTGASRVVKFAPDGTQLATWGDWGTDLGHFRWPMNVAVDADSGTIYVADTFNDRLIQIIPRPG